MVMRPRYQVFISHASVDLWVAKQIDAHIRAIGAASFFDSANIATGDDFEEKMITAAETCDELVVLLTPRLAPAKLHLDRNRHVSQPEKKDCNRGIRPRVFRADERISISAGHNEIAASQHKRHRVLF